jgi:glycosyltransferase involved in cell wall biosynthesis
MLVEGEDPQRLSKAVVALLADQVLRDRLGQAARRAFLARFTAETMARTVEEILLRRISPS